MEMGRNRPAPTSGTRDAGQGGARQKGGRRDSRASGGEYHQRSFRATGSWCFHVPWTRTRGECFIPLRPHRSRRSKVIHQPTTMPCFSNASRLYSEHEGCMGHCPLRTEERCPSTSSYRKKTAPAATGPWACGFGLDAAQPEAVKRQIMKRMHRFIGRPIPIRCVSQPVFRSRYASTPATAR